MWTQQTQDCVFMISQNDITSCVQLDQDVVGVLALTKL
jgi:hypothetical protein